VAWKCVAGGSPRVLKTWSKSGAAAREIGAENAAAAAVQSTSDRDARLPVRLGRA
jgi:hypothetical protein